MPKSRNRGLNEATPPLGIPKIEEMNIKEL